MYTCSILDKSAKFPEYKIRNTILDKKQLLMRRMTSIWKHKRKEKKEGKEKKRREKKGEVKTNHRHENNLGICGCDWRQEDYQRGGRDKRKKKRVSSDGEEASKVWGRAGEGELGMNGCIAIMKNFRSLCKVVGTRLVYASPS